MDDKLTNRLRVARQMALQESQRFDAPAINTGHMLIGLIKCKRGVAAKVLAELGIDVGTVRRAAERIALTGDIDEDDTSDVMRLTGGCAERFVGSTGFLVDAVIADAPLVVAR